MKLNFIFCKNFFLFLYCLKKIKLPFFKVKFFFLKKKKYQFHIFKAPHKNKISIHQLAIKT
jgi:hypothetical protein